MLRSSNRTRHDTPSIARWCTIATSRLVEVTHNAPVLVLSYKLAIELSPSGDAAAMLGRDVRVRGRAFTAIGVMPPYTGETGFAVFIPIRAAANALGVQKQLMPSLYVRAPSLETVDLTKGRIIDWLAMRYRDWDRQVSLNDANVALSRYGHQRDNVVSLRNVEESATHAATLTQQRYRAGTNVNSDSTSHSTARITRDRSENVIGARITSQNVGSRMKNESP